MKTIYTTAALLLSLGLCACEESTPETTPTSQQSTTIVTTENATENNELKDLLGRIQALSARSAELGSTAAPTLSEAAAELVSIEENAASVGNTEALETYVNDGYQDLLARVNAWQEDANTLISKNSKAGEISIDSLLSDADNIIEAITAYTDGANTKANALLETASTFSENVTSKATDTNISANGIMAEAKGIYEEATSILGSLNALTGSVTGQDATTLTGATEQVSAISSSAKSILDTATQLSKQADALLGGALTPVIELESQAKQYLELANNYGSQLNGMVDNVRPLLEAAGGVNGLLEGANNLF